MARTINILIPYTLNAVESHLTLVHHNLVCQFVLIIRYCLPWHYFSGNVVWLVSKKGWGRRKKGGEIVTKNIHNSAESANQTFLLANTSWTIVIPPRAISYPSSYLLYTMLSPSGGRSAVFLILLVVWGKMSLRLRKNSCFELCKRVRVLLQPVPVPPDFPW